MSVSVIVMLRMLARGNAGLMREFCRVDSHRVISDSTPKHKMSDLNCSHNCLIIHFKISALNDYYKKIFFVSDRVLMTDGRVRKTNRTGSFPVWLRLPI